MSRVLEFHELAVSSGLTRKVAYDPISHDVFWVSGWVGSEPVLAPAWHVPVDERQQWGAPVPAGAVSMMNRLEVPDGVA